MSKLNIKKRKRNNCKEDVSLKEDAEMNILEGNDNDAEKNHEDISEKIAVDEADKQNGLVKQKVNEEELKQEMSLEKEILIEEDDEIESVRDYDEHSYNMQALVEEDYDEKKIKKASLHEKKPVLAIQTVFMIVVSIATLVFLGLAIYYHNQSLEKKELNLKIEGLEGQLAIEKEKNAQLTQMVTELTEKNDILSGTVTSKSDSLSELERENQAKMLPDNYPLKGTAALIEGNGPVEEPEVELVPIYDTSANDASGNAVIIDYVRVTKQPKNNIVFDENIPAVRFMCDVDTKVVAAGDGVVISANSDLTNECEIVIDHGNGYISMYHGYIVPFIGEGDEVSKGTSIGLINEVNSKFEYKVTLDGEYIDPMDVMNING